MSDSKTIFTDLTLDEEASLLGGRRTRTVRIKNPNSLTNSVNTNVFNHSRNIISVRGGAGRGGAVFTNAGNAEGGFGLVFN